MDISFDVDKWQDLAKTCPNLIYGSSPRIKINVSGHIYEVYTGILDAYPKTLLGNVDEREKYRLNDQMLFFARHPTLFSSILFYYIQGFVQRPLNIPADLFIEECRFFSIPIAQDEDDDLLILHYEQIQQDRLVIHRWLFYFSLLITVVSCWNLFDENDPWIFSSHWPALISKFIEIICTLWFMIEFYLRVFFWSKSDPNENSYWLLFIDLTSISPMFFSLVIHSLSQWFSSLNRFSTFSVVLKSFRILRFLRHFPSFDLIRQSVFVSLNHFSIAFILSSIFIIPFGVAIYLCERNDSSSIIIDFNSSLQWAIETLTTIGFGAYLPQTYLGRILAIVLCVLGLIILALPIPMVFANYQIIYQNALKEHLWRKYR